LFAVPDCRQVDERVKEQRRSKVRRVVFLSRVLRWLCDRRQASLTRPVVVCGAGGRLDCLCSPVV